MVIDDGGNSKSSGKIYDASEDNYSRTRRSVSLQKQQSLYDRSKAKGPSSVLTTSAEKTIDAKDAQVEVEFSRGAPKGSAKLFDPKKDNPLTQPAVQRSDAKESPAVEYNRVSKSEMKHHGIKPTRSRNNANQNKNSARKTSQAAVSPALEDGDAYQRWKHTVIVPCDGGKPKESVINPKMYILQNPGAGSSEIPELVRELQGPKYDDKSQVEEARRLHAAAKLAESTAKESVERLLCLKSGSDHNADALLLETVSDHRALLDIYYDFLVLTQHPAASEALKKLPKSYKILDRLWSVALSPLIAGLKSILNSCESANEAAIHTCEVTFSFLYYAYAVFASLAICVPSMKVEWYESLGKLAIDIDEMPEQPELDRSVPKPDWKGTAIKWYKQAARYSPGVGRFYFQLYQLYPSSESLARLYFIKKAALTQRPHASNVESILFNGIEYEQAGADQFESDKFDGPFIQYLSAIRLPSSLMDCNNLVSEMFESDALWPNSARLAFLNICTIHEVITSAPAEKTDEVLGRLSIADDVGDQSALIPARMLTKACQSDEAGALAHVFVWLVYLMYATKQSQWATIGKLIPWASLALAINRQRNSTFFTPDTFKLQQLPVISHEDLPGLLPEDSIVRGSIFAVPIWPEEKFCGIEVDDEEDTLVLSSKIQLNAVRSERILWLGYRLTFQCDSLNYNASFHTFSASPDPPEISQIHPASSTLSIVPGYTVIVCDTTVLLQELGLVEAAIAAGLSLVVPLATLKELDRLRQESYEHSPDVAKTATTVISKLEFLAKSRKLRVVAANGSALRDLSFRNEVDVDHTGNFEERLVSAAKHQASHHAAERGSMKRQDIAHLVVLLSASHKTRLASFHDRIFAASPAFMRLVLAGIK